MGLSVHGTLDTYRAPVCPASLTSMERLQWGQQRTCDWL